MENRASLPWRLAFCGQGAWLILAGSAVGIASFLSYRPASSPAVDKFGLQIEPKILDLGALSPGRSRSTVMLHNFEDTSQQVHWSSSCDCVSVEPRVVRVPPNDTRAIRVIIDVDDDVGPLGVMLTGRTESGQELSAFTVRFAANGSMGPVGAQESKYESDARHDAKPTQQR